MKIKLRNQYCGPAGVFPAGTELDLPTAEAKQLVDGGYADAVKPRAAKKPAKDDGGAGDKDDDGEKEEGQQ